MKDIAFSNIANFRHPSNMTIGFASSTLQMSDSGTNPELVAWDCRISYFGFGHHDLRNDIKCYHVNIDHRQIQLFWYQMLWFNGTFADWTNEQETQFPLAVPQQISNGGFLTLICSVEVYTFINTSTIISYD